MGELQDDAQDVVRQVDHAVLRWAALLKHSALREILGRDALVLFDEKRVGGQTSDLAPDVQFLALQVYGKQAPVPLL